MSKANIMKAPMAKPQEKELPVSAIATDLELCEKSEFVATDLTEAMSWTIESLCSCIDMLFDDTLAESAEADH